MPHIEQAQLVAFASEKVNLSKDEVNDQRDQVNSLRTRISNKIAAEPGYGLVKSLLAGSVAKGTALRNVNDRDLAVYVRADKAPHDTPGLVNWLHARVVEAYPRLHDDQIVANERCVTVTFKASGLTVDVVPVLYEDDPDDIGYLVEKSTGDRIRTSVRQHLDFIRARKKKYPTHLAQLIRFTKWWSRLQKRKDRDFRCKSFMLELIWTHLADNGLALSDYPLALEKFFCHIYMTELREQIAFTDYHSVDDLPARGSSAIEILDPTNFDNNIACRYTDNDRDNLVSAAEQAFNNLSTARFASTKGDAVECWQDVLGTSFKGDS